VRQPFPEGQADYLADDQVEIDSQVYLLDAIVEHIGATSGHDVVCVGDAQGWMCCNGKSVTISSLKDVHMTIREPRRIHVTKES
jgi:hypothetical protein